MTKFKLINSDESNLYSIRGIINGFDKVIDDNTIIGGSSNLNLLNNYIESPNAHHLPSNFKIVFYKSPNHFEIVFGKFFTNKPSITINPIFYDENNYGINYKVENIGNDKCKIYFSKIIKNTWPLEYEYLAPSEDNVNGLLGFNFIITGPIKIGTSTSYNNKGWVVDPSKFPQWAQTFLDIGIGIDAPSCPLDVEGNVIMRKNVNMKDLNVSSNTELKDLTVSGNSGLNNLDVSGNSGLKDLIVSGNTGLKDLIVSGNSELNNLTVSNNTELNNLTVSGDSELNNFKFNSYVLTKKTITTNKTLTELDSGNTILLNKVDGIIVDLPDNSTGENLKFKIVILTTTTSNSIEIRSNGEYIGGIDEINTSTAVNQEVTSDVLNGVSGNVVLNQTYISKTFLDSADITNSSSTQDLMSNSSLTLDKTISNPNINKTFITDIILGETFEDINYKNHNDVNTTTTLLKDTSLTKNSDDIIINTDFLTDVTSSLTNTINSYTWLYDVSLTTTNSTLSVKQSDSANLNLTESKETLTLYNYKTNIYHHKASGSSIILNNDKNRGVRGDVIEIESVGINIWLISGKIYTNQKGFNPTPFV
jgi:hypothetical protein